MANKKYHVADTGWAWVVFLASGGCHLIVGGVIYFVGVAHSGLLSKFNSNSVTFLATIGALFSGLACLAGPLACVIINNYGCRTCCMLGGIFCFVGITATAFVTSQFQLLLTYGIIAGLGMGFSFTSATIVVGFYFDRKRGLASGLSNSFQAVGVLYGGVLFQTLINNFGIDGAFLLVGAISSHLCIFAMFFRPTAYDGIIVQASSEQNEDYHTPQIDQFECKTSSVAHNRIQISSSLTALCHKNDKVTNIGIALADVMNSTGSICLFRNVEQHILMDCVSKQRDSNGVIALGNQQFCQNGNSKTLRENDFKVQSSIECNSETSSKYDMHALNSKAVIDNCNYSPDTNCINKETYCCSDLNDVENPHNDLCISDKASSWTSSYSCNTSANDWPDEQPSSPTPLLRSIDQVWETKPHNKIDSLLASSKNRSISVLLDWPFLSHCAGVFLANIYISGVFLHLPAFAQESGATANQAASLLVFVGLGSLSSKLISAFAVSDPSVDPIILCVGMMALSGITTCVFILFPGTLALQRAYAALFGLFYGGTYALINPILIRLVGVHNLSIAYGGMSTFMGLGYTLGPMLAAAIKDRSGEYTYGFLFLGLTMLGGSIFNMVAGAMVESKEKT